MYYIYNKIIDPDEELEALRQKLISTPAIKGFLDAKFILCKEQLLHAINLTEIAFETGINKSTNWGIELDLTLAGTTQIVKALELFDLKQNTKSLILITETPLDPNDFKNIKEGFPDFDPSIDALNYFNIISDFDNPCKKAMSKSILKQLK